MKIIKKIIPIIVIITINIFLFKYSIYLRKDNFGKLYGGDHHFLTGSTIKFSKNWYYEGPSNIYFSMLENPKSIEFNNIKERKPYVSYPPGAIVPIYLISLIINKEPSTEIVMKYNLFNHFFISFFLSLISYFFLINLNISKTISLLFSIIPIIISLFTVGPFYFLQNIYFSDQAVILPILITIFLEILYDKNKKKYIKLIQFMFLTYAAFTDWLTYFLIIFLLIKSFFIDKNKKIGYLIIIAGLIPIFFLLWQIYKLQAFNILLERFITRTGLSNNLDDKKNFIFTFWLSYFKINFGFSGIFLYLFSIIYLTLLIFLFKKINKNTLFYLLMFSFLTLIQIYFFKNHSIVHDFSTLKFIIPLSLLPFVLNPIITYILIKKENDNKKIINNFLIIIFILLTFSLIALFLLKIKNWFYGKDFINIFQSIVYSLTIINPIIIFFILKRKKHVLFILFLINLLLSISYIKTSFPLKNLQFKAKQDMPYEKIGESIKKCTKYNDVVFSFDIEIPENPPILLSQSMKRIYKIKSLEEIKNKIRSIKNNKVNIKIFYLDYPQTNKYSFLKKIGFFPCYNYYYSNLNFDLLNKIK